MITGWRTIGSKTYYFDKNGVMVTGKQTIGGKTYTFNSKGQLKGKAPRSAAAATTKFSSSDAGSKIIWNSSLEQQLFRHFLCHKYMEDREGQGSFT